MAADGEAVRVLVPPPGEARGVVCVVLRDLAAGGPVAATVPANVYGCINLVFEGRVTLAAPHGDALPPAFVTGPFTRALSTHAHAPLRSASIVLHPWALTAWCGIGPDALRDSLCDLARLPACGAWLPALRQSLCPAEPGAVAWPAASIPEPSEARRWSEALLRGVAVGDAAAEAGLSPRQFQRRFNALFGLPPKTWQRIKRVEATLCALAGPEAAAPPTAPPTGMAELAGARGYADQPHMTRDFAAVAGHPPGRVRDALASQAPGWWAFRPARVRNLQDRLPAPAYAAGHES